MLREVTVLVGLWCACSAVLHAKRVCVCEDEYARDRCVYRSVYVFVYSGTSISRASRYIEVPLYYTLEWPFRLVNNSDCILQLSFSDPPFALRETKIISPLLYSLGTQRTNKDQQQNNLIDFLL